MAGVMGSLTSRMLAVEDMPFCCGALSQFTPLLFFALSHFQFNALGLLHSATLNPYF